MKTSRIDEYIRRQENITQVTRQELERIQLDKLNAVLEREKLRGGFYAGLPGRLDSLGELAKLPFTTDEELAHNAARLLLVSQADIRRVLSDATSGTTGTAKRVFYTEGDCRSTVELFMAGLGELVHEGSVTMICMPFSGPFGLGELIAEAIEGLGARPLKTGVSKSYGELRDILERERPDTFVGMPVQLLSMLRYCGRGSLRRALVSGDACPASVTAECERLLGTRLFPHYGSREMGLGGAVCCEAHEGMHLRENHVIAEITDAEGRVLPAGELGELVITTVGMEAMPLIRYRTGDRARILPGRCPCGSEVLRLDSLSRLAGAKMQELDDALFSLGGLVDFSAVECGGELRISALGTADIAGELKKRAEQLFPELSVAVSLRAARDTDKALYSGKRIIKTC